MVANINKLKGIITENGYSMKSLADELGMCETTIRNKINNKNSDFYVGESWKLKEILNLSLKDYLYIFYNENID